MGRLKIYFSTNPTVSRLERKKMLAKRLRPYNPPPRPWYRFFWAILFWKMFSKLAFAYHYNIHIIRSALRGIFSDITSSRHVCVAAVFARSTWWWLPWYALSMMMMIIMINNHTVFPEKLIKNPPAVAVTRHSHYKPYTVYVQDIIILS